MGQCSMLTIELKAASIDTKLNMIISQKDQGCLAACSISC